MDKKDIKNFTLEELKKEFTGMNLPPYRAKQVFSWVYKKGARDFGSMDDIPKLLRHALEKKYYIGDIELAQRHRSKDGTEKFLFKLHDGHFTETVLIKAKNRKTACLSTQVGCRFKCAFCASGLKGFVRDLTSSEMTGQALYLEHVLKCKPTNFVFMGMGEPLDNYYNLAKAITIMNEPGGMAVGARRMTVSTSGIIPGIEKFAKLGLQVNLSISLHAGNNALRNELMPVNRKYPLEKMIDACEDYIKEAGRVITLEYVLIHKKNDTIKDAGELAKIAKRLKAKINLIAYSEVPAFEFLSPPKKTVDRFMKELIKKGAKVTLRESKGKDIKAACGQLAGRI